MKSPTIVAVCPGDVVTGGPEALHQLVDQANEISPGSSFICYEPLDADFDVPEPYRHYRTPVIRRSEIPDDALIVLPETRPQLVTEFSQPCVIWWLSVDYFYSQSGHIESINKAKAHLAQSEYARQHLLTDFGLDPMMVSDYVSDFFRSPPVERIPHRAGQRKIRVAVNARWGDRRRLRAVRRSIRRLRRRFRGVELVEICEMPRSIVKSELAASAVYIDFGHHPGKDRLPREAALQDTVVLVANLGAAANPVDMPIGDFYKFSSADDIAPKLEAILSNLQWHLDEQAEYRAAIRLERTIFRREVAALLKLAAELGTRRCHDREPAAHPMGPNSADAATGTTVRKSRRPDGIPGEAPSSRMAGCSGRCSC